MNKLVKGRGVLQSIGYTGICFWKGYGFQDIYSGIGSSNNRKLVMNRVLFNGIAHKRLRSRTIEHFNSDIGSQNLQNLV